MSEDSSTAHPFPEAGDPLGKLLARDAAANPVIPSPWFATRTAALARTTPQAVSPVARLFSLLSQRSLRPMKRWLLPVPLAGLAAVTLLVLSHRTAGPGSAAVASSEEEFEDHIEMLFAYGD